MNKSTICTTRNQADTLYALSSSKVESKEFWYPSNPEPLKQFIWVLCITSSPSL